MNTLPVSPARKNDADLSPPRQMPDLDASGSGTLCRCDVQAGSVALEAPDGADTIRIGSNQGICSQLISDAFLLTLTADTGQSERLFSPGRRKVLACRQTPPTVLHS